MTKTDRAKSHLERPLRLFQSAAKPYHSNDDSASSLASGEDIETELPLEASEATGLPPHIHEGSKPRPHVAFHRHAEATPSELFYDLFFVANLATFTSQNEINKIEGLQDYIGFFCVLWFTWFQVSLFDLRFSRDSIFDRLCKVGQFGVMIGFSFVALKFDPAGASDGFVDGKSLSIIIMASRLIIALQYFATLLTLRHHPGTTLPLVLMISTYIVSAAIFLGISFDFTTEGSKQEGSLASVGWYVVTVMESVISIAISCIWRFASFKGTHIVERMNLMTLIILGEGILGLSSAVVTVWDTTYYFPGIGVAVMSTILLIYGIYQLYFDTIAEEHFGTLKQQLWAVLHFPLHLALVLFDEGTKQFVIWSVACTQQTEFDDAIQNVPIFNMALFGSDADFSGAQNTSQFFADQADALWSAYENFASVDLGVSNAGNGTELNEFYDSISNGTSVGADAVIEAVIGFWATVVKGILDNLNIEGAEVEANASSTNVEMLVEETLAAFNLFDMVFTYFYVGTSVAVLLILALWLLSKKSKNTVFDYVRFAAWAAVGLTIGFVALLDISAVQGNDPGNSFVNGNWVLPVPMILIVALVMIFHLPF